MSCLWLTGCKQQWDQYSTQLETHRLSKVQLYIPRLWRYCLLCNSLINRISSCSSWYMFIYIYIYICNITLPNYIFDNFWYNIMYDFIWFVILYKLLWNEVQGRLWSKPLLNFPGTSLITIMLKWQRPSDYYFSHDFSARTDPPLDTVFYVYIIH